MSSAIWAQILVWLLSTRGVTRARPEAGLLPESRIVTYYGNPLSKKMGILGEIPPEEMVKRLQIKTSSLELPVASMSGGNQQKVVLAKCLSTEPVCLLCDEPTRGIDEGAKQEIYHLLDQFVRAGGAAIVVSSEAPELLHLSDRIAVFKGGRLVTISTDTALSQEALLSLAS